MATKDGPLNWRQKGAGGGRGSSPGGSGGGPKPQPKPKPKPMKTMRADDFVPNRMTTKKVSQSLRDEAARRKKAFPDKRTSQEVRRVRMTSPSRKASMLLMDVKKKKGPS